jgi:tRNA-dihydrouridine synthase B
MAEAARIVEGQGARIIDINMGCPAKKVVGGLSGSALMRDLDHALRLIEAVVAAVDVPVTLKTRLGWDDDALNAPELARRAEAAGVAMITIHGRTRCQFYKGRADWAAIRAVKRGRDDPGHRQWRHLLRHRREGRAGGFRRRRGHGRARRAGAALGAGGDRGELFGAPARMCPKARTSRHGRAPLRGYAVLLWRVLGPRVARKHLGWYMDGAGTPGPLRKAILTAPTPPKVLRLLPDARSTRAPRRWPHDDR